MNKSSFSLTHIGIGGIVLIILAFASFGILPSLLATQSSTATTEEPQQKKVQEDVPQKQDSVPHTATPEAVKAIYMTSWVASTPSLREPLFDLIDETELNSIVIDIKDDTGRISYDAKDPAIVAEGAVEVRITDLPDVLADLHSRGIYVIGRIAVFQDPYLAPKWTDEAVGRKSTGGVWKDRKGLSWIDAGSTRYWEYIVALARDAHSVGFDEINFDYVRYPTDGSLADMHLPRTGDTPKSVKLTEFFKYVNEKMDESGIPSSADVFGLVTTSHDDMNIGQILENALVYFDYVYPMVYPSHYGAGSYGYDNPNDYPYEIVHTSMKEAVRRASAIGTVTKPAAGATTTLSATDVFAAQFTQKVDPKKLRPWLQDFDYGGDYDAADVRAQIQATYDAGLDSWLLWNASNKYTRGGLLSE